MTTAQVEQRAHQIAGARRARAERVGGILWVKERNGRRYARVPSRTSPGTFYHVDGTGCTCEGYQHRGWCAHWDAVMIRLAERLKRETARPTYYTARDLGGEVLAVMAAEIAADGAMLAGLA